MRKLVIIAVSLVAGSVLSCSSEQTNTPANRPQNTASAATPAQPAQSPQSAPAAKPQRSPAKGVTAKDIAKVAWLEGFWRGTGADKPFFNLYRFMGTTLKIQSFEDEEKTKPVDAATYELKDGIFANPSGDHRFAASEITDSYIQFVTLTGTTEQFRMERQADGTVKAVMEWTGQDGKAEKKEYILEPLKK